MNDRIDWGEGSFEFVKKQDLESIPVKQYRSNTPFALCKHCLGKKCEFLKFIAGQASKDVYKILFGESLDDENVLFSKVSSIAAEIKNALSGSTDEYVYMCAFVQLLQLVDDETCVDITDELVERLCIAFSDVINE